MEYYRAQGVHAPPGFKPIVGHMPMLSAVRNFSKSLIGTEKPSPKNLFYALLDETTETKAEDSYDYTNNTVSILGLIYPLLLV